MEPLSGVKNDITMSESLLAAAYKTTQTPTPCLAIPILDIYPREIKYVHKKKKKASQIFIATLCKITKSRNSPGVYYDENELTGTY